MKRFFASIAWLSAAVFLSFPAVGQSTLDALDQELKEVKQQHDDATAQSLANFFSQVDPAMAGNDAAVALWQQAGGGVPAPTPVTTEYETESESEREARQAKDKANYEVLGELLQVHCGLLHYGATLIIDPKRAGLQDDFNAWLARIAQAYPQLMAAATPPAPPTDADNNGKHHRHIVPTADSGTATVPPVHLQDVVNQSLQDSLITKYLSATNLWKDKDQGGWSIASIPGLFKSRILDPSRATPTPATLNAWDVYIAMMQAGESDPDKWTSTDFPPLQFERAYDDYAITPGTEKLEVLVQIIHANPTHPSADDWLTRTRALLDTYRSGHGGLPATTAQNTTPAPPATVNNGNVTVTTVQQGNAQIIITHTNSPPANPTP